jgi:hypothetical protein
MYCDTEAYNLTYAAGADAEYEAWLRWYEPASGNAQNMFTDTLANRCTPFPCGLIRLEVAVSTQV